MNAFTADSFDDLVQQCVSSGTQHAMLYVFLRVSPVDPAQHPELGEDDEATMVQVLFDAHQPVAHGLNFSSVCETADKQNPDWNMVVVGVARNADASQPSAEQAQAFLADIREKIMSGMIDGYALLDRDGNRVDVGADVVPLEGGPAIN